MIDPKVADYIKTSLAQGKTKEELYKELLNQGWTIEVIQENFSAIESVKEQKSTQERTIKIIVTIGAILVGAGVFSFIAANWQAMTKPTKISIIIVSMLMSYGAGWYLKEKLNFAKTGEALFLLGSIIYGAGIFLIAQMFHTRANWPDGFILWMFGTIAMAFALESFPHFYLAIILGFIAVIGHPTEIFTGIFGYRSFLLTSSFLLLIVTIVTFITGWLVRKKLPPELKDFYLKIMRMDYFWLLIISIIIIGLIIFFIALRRQKKGTSITKEKDWYLHLALSKEDAVSQLFFLLSVSFLGVTLLAFNRDFGEPLSWRTILFLTSLVGIVSTYYFKIVYTLPFSLVGLTTWWSVKASDWIAGKNIKTAAGFTGLLFIALLFYVLGHLHEKEMKFKRVAFVYLILGIIPVIGALFFFSTKPGLSVLANITKGTSFFGSWQLALSLFVFSASIISVLLYTLSKKLTSGFEAFAVILLTFLYTTFTPSHFWHSYLYI